jgi:hypothetical protein
VAIEFVQLPSVPLQALHPSDDAMNANDILFVVILATLAALCAMAWTHSDSLQLHSDLERLRKQRKNSRTP